VIQIEILQIMAKFRIGFFKVYYNSPNFEGLYVLGRQQLFTCLFKIHLKDCDVSILYHFNTFFHVLSFQFQENPNCNVIYHLNKNFKHGSFGVFLS